jgi:micrococcal nuclease
MYTYKATVDEIIDGDTVDVTVDLGFSTYKSARLRLNKIDTPETRTRRDKEKKAGKLVEEFLKKLLKGESLTIKTSKDLKGSFGRYLADLYIEDIDISINQYLLNKGYAREYISGAPEWKGKDLNHIIEDLSFLDSNTL